ncbi:MAG TPA: PH domain-containing protein [Candidatus Angelobacter sp.]|jgi:uncharacterized membrane protein YdbT with pleckstrin-like domain|nr:PH domain-containing protein [Candidatus Angelobacter sp.]
MSYVDKYLLSGETVAYRTRPHWIVSAKPLAEVILLLIVLGVSLALLGSKLRPDETRKLYIYIAIGGTVLALIAYIVPMIKRRSVECILTNQRIIIKTGILRHRTTEMFLNRVESVSVDQTFWGRMLNYGNLTLHGAGGTPEPFTRIAKALEFQREVQEQIKLANLQNFPPPIK